MKYAALALRIETSTLLVPASTSTELQWKASNACWPFTATAAPWTTSLRATWWLACQDHMSVPRLVTSCTTQSTIAEYVVPE